ncbi:hypothetical protein [Methylohalobius crimeensis]|uniref:hypothetical protein n=1 Tax=Methylohalobius crimeensis TaxID=244365 RepID=UPI0003B676FB|nr:hypothetical protein [Methylohalobius crimeensis]
MLGGLLAILVAIWFYRSADRVGHPEPFKWGAIGAAVYYVAMFLWRWFANTGFMETLHHSSVTMGMLVHYAGVAIGLLAAWWLRKYHLLRLWSEEKTD